MSKKKGTTIKGRGLWDFDTTPPTQVMTDRELADYKRNGLPIPTYALDIPDDEMYANLYAPSVPVSTTPQLMATSSSSFIPPTTTQLPNLRISPDMYFLNTIPVAERRAMALERELRDLELEVRELKKKASSKKKKATPKKKKRRSVSKKKKRRSKSK